VDTDITAAIEAPKLDPAEVARHAVEAIASGTEEVLVDPLSRQVEAALAGDLHLLHPVAVA
jgi:hypothetical protein